MSVCMQSPFEGFLLTVIAMHKKQCFFKIIKKVEMNEFLELEDADSLIEAQQF